MNQLFRPPAALMICIACINGCRFAAPIPSADDDRPPAFLGVSYRPVSGAECKSLQKVCGLRVIQVFPESAAEKAGLQVGDVIVGFDGRTLGTESIPSGDNLFLQYIQNHKRAGDSLFLEILRTDTHIRMKRDGDESVIPDLDKLNDRLRRQPNEQSLSVTIERHSLPRTIAVTLGAFQESDPTAYEKIRARFSHYENTPDPIADLMQGLIRNHNLSSQYQDFQSQLVQNELPDDRFHLDIVEYIRRNPMKLNTVGLQLSKEIVTMADGRSFGDLINKSSELLDVAVERTATLFPQDIPLPPTSTDFTEHIQYIQTILAAALACRHQAFGGISQDDQDFLTRHIPRLLENITQSCNSGQIDNPDTPPDDLRCIALCHQIDYQKLFTSARISAALVNPAWLALFQESVKAARLPAGNSLPGVSGQIIYQAQTDSGLFLIGGYGPNRYGRDDIAAVIDLGGDDLYVDGSGSPNHPVNIRIDLTGDDRYEASSDFAQGTGFMGVGILADLAGDDQYTGLRVAQGAGVMGVGILMDAAGSDVYRGQELNQGVAYWGMGLLLDCGGDDRYESHFHSQGVGGPKGIGLLLDTSGDDRYYASGKYPSCYGTPGMFQGLSQGFGFGLRGYAAGGIGILIDNAGRDRFEAGDFSQGGGYALGMGLLKNSGNNDDTYIGSRYAQGFAAHSAAGILIDEGGNDAYSGLVGAVQAAAWDRGVAVLNDQAGDDVYNAQDLFFAQGAAAHNGFSLFMDGAGQDRYLAPKDGKIGANTYHGGCSFSFFIDGDGDAIVSERVTGEYGFVVERR